MSITQTWQILVLISKVRKLLNNNRELWEKYIEPISEEQKICVICHIAGPTSALIDKSVTSTVTIYVAPQWIIPAAAGAT